MPNYEDYFSAKNIIKTLCKYRIKQAKKKHKLHLLRDISLHKVSILLLKNKHNCPPSLKELFPSRRTWHRANNEERKKFDNSQDTTIFSLYKTITSIHYKVINGIITQPDWYVKLQQFIERVQARAANPDMMYIQSPVINPIKKDNTPTCKVCRPISLYNLEDRIIIGFTAKYLTDLFDPFLHNCSYAFRSSKLEEIRTHHDTINKIAEYRKERPKKPIYVAECDLEKFFDCLNHKTIIEAFEKFIFKVTDSGAFFESKARKIFNQYLASYTFNKTVLKYNGTHYFDQFGIPGGVFDWPHVKLESNYYGDKLLEEDIGVPQGGALSCLIANFLLHEVDEAVDSEPKDPELLYLRFCDDMVILHTIKEKCDAALNRYLLKIDTLNLIVHKPEVITNYDRGFWKTKSKSPYNWSSNSNAKSAVPWLGFVGYQIRYDGIIRVRKKSLLKEATKQKHEMLEVLKALNLNKRTKHRANEHSRKSKKQQIYALENRLISMSVGRANLYNYKTAQHGLCWTNGFKCLDMNFVSRTQCKYLDRSRKHTLSKFGKTLSNLIKPSEKPSRLSEKTFYGHPFSYHGFLK